MYYLFNLLNGQNCLHLFLNSECVHSFIHMYHCELLCSVLNCICRKEIFMETPLLIFIKKLHNLHKMPPFVHQPKGLAIGGEICIMKAMRKFDIWTLRNSCVKQGTNETRGKITSFYCCFISRFIIKVSR